jgi:exonuclease III
MECRGLNSPSKQHSVRTFIDSVGADIVCLQETKMQNISRGTGLAILGVNFEEFLFLPTSGASGGILLAWKRHVQATGHNRMDTYSVSVQFQQSNGQPWWLTGVYGPQDIDDKILFLQELRQIRTMGCCG